MIDPYATYVAYCDAERRAADAYRAYWADKFINAGIPLVENQADYAPYVIHIFVSPHQFEGVKVEVRRSPPSAHKYYHWHSVKVKSETGFAKLIDRIHRGFYK